MFGPDTRFQTDTLKVKHMADTTNLIETRQPVHGAAPSYNDDFLIHTPDGELLLDDAEWLGEDSGESPDEDAPGDLDEPWWLGERDAPSDDEMQRWFNTSLGADMALA